MLKSSPEAPGEGYILAEIAEEVGLPPGVLNVVTADREVSELLVRDPRVDKITFTGSTAAGRRIASICGERIARCTLELGGKSAAVILDDIDLETVAQTIDLRPERGVHRRRGASARSRGNCALGQSATTRFEPISGSRSVASSSQGSAAKEEPKGSTLSWRPRR